jgi:3-oxoacyl-[acyl-carrier protein] reductase
MRCCRAAIPKMKARKAGAIVIISSISGSMVGGGVPSYNVAKAAEIMYARTLARDLAPFGIRANTVSPGSIMFEGGGWARRKASHPATSSPETCRAAASGRPRRSPTSRSPSVPIVPR